MNNFRMYCPECKKMMMHKQEGFSLPVCIMEHSYTALMMESRWMEERSCFRNWLDKLDLVQFLEIQTDFNQKVNYEAAKMEAEQLERKK